MTKVLTDPAATGFNNGAIVPSGTAHGVLSDENDTTYVELDYTESVRVSFTKPTIPAGAMVKQLEVLEKSKRDNTYWLGTVMAQSQEDKERLDLIRGRDADYASITTKDLDEVAKKYLTEKSVLKVLIHPDAAAKEGE